MTAPPPTPHTIVLVIDGLRAAALGAYGVTAYETPALDRLASEAVVYDWVLADSHEARVVYEKLADSLGETPDATLLVTDDPSLPGESFAGRFDQRRVIQPSGPVGPAETIGDAALAETLAGSAEAIAERFSRLGEGERLLAWTHCRGLYGPWDAPTELRESLVTEDDPELPEGVDPPDEAHGDNTSTEACDARFAATVRYAAQVRALDALLEGWIEVIDDLLEGESLRLVLLGLRGYPLGEHGRVGGVDGRLFTEQLHTPLLVRDTTPDRHFSREAQPLLLSAALAHELGDAGLPPGPAVVRAPGGAVLVREATWSLRQPGGEDPTGADELYLKPDDRWDQNDVAKLEPETAERLAGEAG